MHCGLLQLENAGASPYHNNLLYIQKILVYARQLCASMYCIHTTHPEDQFVFVSEFSCDDRQKGKRKNVSPKGGNFHN
jgi:hypothetical protein